MSGMMFLIISLKEREALAKRQVASCSAKMTLVGAPFLIKNAMTGMSTLTALVTEQGFLFL